LEHESHHHHPHHGTGMRWLDITLGVAAALVSLVSLWLGLHSAHSMEKLVAANSFPYLEQVRSMASLEILPGTDRFRRLIEYDLVNNGIGPARIEWVEYKFNGKVVTNLDELLDACCQGMAHRFSGMNRRGNVEGSLVRAGATLPLFTWTEQVEEDPAFDALHKQMGRISWKTCYCSVFDECYVQGEEASMKPVPVKECKAPARPFRPAFRKDL
jgi:hypothetical protein